MNKNKKKKKNNFGFIKKIFIALVASIVCSCSHTKLVFLSNQKCETHPTHINLILMNTIKNYNIIPLRLNWIDVLEVAILLMTYLIKYVLQTKQNI